MKTSPALPLLLLAVCAASALAQPEETLLAEAARRYETSAPVPLLGREAFVAEPAIREMLLAPDGRYVAWLASEGHHTALLLLEAATGRTTRLFSSTALDTLNWTRDGRHLILGLGNAVGVVNLDAPDRPARLATLDAGRNERFLRAPQAVLDRVLIGGREADGSHTLEAVTLDGERRELLRQDAMVWHALDAADGTAVIVDSATAEGHRFELVAGTERTPLLSCALLETCKLLAWQEAAGTLWLTANANDNFIGLMAYTFADGSLRSIHRHPDAVVDIADVTVAAGQPLVAQYRDGLLQSYGLDAPGANVLRAVQSRLPGSALRFQASADRSVWLVTETGALLQHPRHHFFEPASGTLTEILREERDVNPALEPAQLSERIPLRYKAGDGTPLHGYVSFPKGRPLRATPLLALVHGGPMGRVDSSYDGFVQFLVNRGYIVFEPNFRASTGYGRAYVEAAADQIGDGLVQQDIVDGVHYLLAQGIGDPERVGIAGHSFGGSSVLAGLAFTPELFKAGFASAPAADLAPVMKFQNTPQRLRDVDPAIAALAELVLGSVDDAERMQAMTARSPRARLDAIRAPLLLIAGGADRQVPIAHVKDYTLELLNQGKTFSFFLDEAAGHEIGMAPGRMQLAYFWMAEAFLGAHLGGDWQELDDPGLAAYIGRRMLLATDPAFTVPVSE